MYLGQEIGQVHARGSFMQDFRISLFCSSGFLLTAKKLNPIGPTGYSEYNNKLLKGLRNPAAVVEGTLKDSGTVTTTK